jgi:dUTP pyrophosphatase
MNLRVFKLSSLTPEIGYGTQSSACFDLSACLADRPSIKGFYGNNEPVIFICVNDDSGIWIKIPSKARVLVPTGMILDIPENHCVKVYPRSGLSVKQGLGLCNSVGVVDSDYVEELFIPVINHSEKELIIKHGDRIAQAELVLSNQCSIGYIDERPKTKTDRVGGFGSTGTDSLKSTI